MFRSYTPRLFLPPAFYVSRKLSIFPTITICSGTYKFFLGMDVDMTQKK